MKRSDCKDLIRKLDSYEGLSYGVVIRQDLLTGEITSSYVMSNDRLEVEDWLLAKNNIYHKLDVPFVSYADGVFVDSNNKLILED